jgi:hypothetical protein
LNADNLPSQVHHHQQPSQVTLHHEMIDIGIPIAKPASYNRRPQQRSHVLKQICTVYFGRPSQPALFQFSPCTPARRCDNRV